jgi:glyoxylase-like metal-dependent hydrolase (beta-lactamase superfamily II)
MTDIEALVLTHSDGDHTGLARTLRDAGARALIHSADEATLRKPGPKSGDAKPINIVPQLRHPAWLKLVAHMALSGGLRATAIEGAETFSGDDVLEVPGRPRVVPTPGHTPGHCALYFEGKGVLFVGDALCTRNPITGRPGAQVMPSALNVSTDQCFASLAAIEQIPAEVALPGHGDPWTQGAGLAVDSARRLGRS